MSLKRKFVSLFLGLFILLWTTLVYSADVNIARQLVLKESPSKINHGWLPDIVGIPNKERVNLLTTHVAEIMKYEQDERCNAIDYNLRLLAFQNFVIYQHMFNKQKHYFKEEMAIKYGHVLAMILKESSGDPINVTGMDGRSIFTNKNHVNLQRWMKILKLSTENGIKIDSQTNFGLTQLSGDRLYAVFKLANPGNHNKDFLEGKYGDKTAVKVNLNSASATRRLIWFYQDIAQGRLSQEDEPIPQEMISDGEFQNRYQKGLRMALLYCGTELLYHKDNHDLQSNNKLDFESAMASIAYCNLAKSKQGYSKNNIDEECFVKWVTLCPALNINIALVTPLSYFQSRDVKPVCTQTLKRLIKKEQHIPSY